MSAIEGKAVVATGASSGIGRAIALELAAAGADLWLVGRSDIELRATARSIAEAGGSVAHVARIDLRERGPLATLVADVAAAHPHLFAIVNNAGVMHPEPISQGSFDRWQAMVDINLLAVLEGCQAAIAAMRAHGQPGHLINIGSSRSKAEEPGVYGATKLAVNAIGASLRRELEHDDIRVTTVIPGGFATQLARGWLPEQIESVSASFARQGVEFGGPDAERLVADPVHAARLVRYILEQPIDLNIQEVVVRPPVSVRN